MEIPLFLLHGMYYVLLLLLLLHGQSQLHSPASLQSTVKGTPGGKREGLRGEGFTETRIFHPPISPCPISNPKKSSQPRVKRCTLLRRAR